MAANYPLLFSPLEIRGAVLKNRIASTAHSTSLTTGQLPNDDFVAYHKARAAGGAGLIVLEVALVHKTAIYSSHTISAINDDCIPAFRRVAEAVHAHSCKVFGQLFHPGREILRSMDGSAPVTYAPSAVPNERFHVMPRAMPKHLIQDVINGYGDAALRMAKAGLDGVEILASQGYLLSQFLNPRVNFRTDEYGGTPRNRVRFLEEIASEIRSKVSEDIAIGVRVSIDEKDSEGLTPEETLEACTQLDQQGQLDYFSIVAGSSATLEGSIHIVPPMVIQNGYLSTCGEEFRAAVSKPVLVTGRINQPQIAERMLAGGQADICGMTRALICDPELPNKARTGHSNDIRACIACNQACIGHMLLDYPLSCIQHPETGRELRYGTRRPADKRRRVLVAGGGPGGMKAAAVAAERAHDVTLYEKGPQLGGQALLAQLLPQRAEFGGIVTNLTREMELAGVEVVVNTTVTGKLVERESPDVVILATGAAPFRPRIEGADQGHVVDAWQVLKREADVGNSAVIADWRCDWVGLGLAEMLARDGCRVRLVVNGYLPGWMIQQYVRDHWIGVLHKLGVEITNFARLCGVDSDTVYFQHTTSGTPILFEQTDTLVLALGHRSVNSLEYEIGDFEGTIHLVGDCLAPRTAEEAVLEGLEAGNAA